MKCPYPILVKTKFGTIRQVRCGQCTACRLNKASEWSLRIMNETLYHEDSCFLTLTYDDEHIPEYGSLRKKDLQKFLKRFRKRYEKSIRYYASGEYGELTHRPHYHLILFGVSPLDEIFKNKRYDRKHDGWHCELDTWNKGLCFTADVTYDDAAYVAKYTMKKITGKKGKQYYKERCIEPEFSLMSLKPGIGAQYMRDNKNKLRRRGFVIGKNGQKCPIPRYYWDRITGPFYREYEARQKAKDVDAKIVEKAKASGKDYFRYKEELLESARNKVKSFMEMKGKKNEV